MSVLVDYFPYFGAYGDELLDLRVNCLRDAVDVFVIAESTRTHSGLPVEPRFQQAAKDLNLPMDKIIYVVDEIPEDNDLTIQNIDIKNTYHNPGASEQQRLASLRARVRERLQKDALLKVLDQFDDDAVFIHSDYDEIINPKENLRWMAQRCRDNQSVILKIPLVLLETRADLRVHWRSNNRPVAWNRSMFMATKAQLRRFTPTQIRSEQYLTVPVHWLVENNMIVEDLGWHFSWMGGAARRDVKTKSYAHFQDGFSWMPKEQFSSFQDPRYVKWNREHKYAPGSMPPSGNVDHVLLKYPTDKLPPLIMQQQNLQQFFLGD